VTGFRRKLDVVFGKKGGNNGKWAVCGHSPAAGGGAAGLGAGDAGFCAPDAVWSELGQDAALRERADKLVLQKYSQMDYNQKR
jgi:hypothetical protein